MDIVVADAGTVYPVPIDPLIAVHRDKLEPEFTGDSRWNDCFDAAVVLNGNAVLTIVKGDWQSPISPVIEVSSNLVNWFSGPRHTTVLENTHRILHVRDNTPITAGPKRYIRLK